MPGHSSNMPRVGTTVPNFVAAKPETGASARRRDSDSRARGRGRDREAVDYTYERDRLPRPVLMKHRESSREGGSSRRHHDEYGSSGSYEPRERPRRTRSADHRRGPVVVNVAERSRPADNRAAAPSSGSHRARRMSNVEGYRERDSRRSDDRRESRRESDTGRRRSAAQNLGKAAITAGALEAVRHRGRGSQGHGDAWKRVATAALGAAAIDAAASKARGKDPRDTGKRTTLGASIGGLMVNSLVSRMRS